MGAFACRQVRQVEKDFRAAQGDEDVRHLKKMVNISIIMYIVGIVSYEPAPPRTCLPQAC